MQRWVWVKQEPGGRMRCAEEVETCAVAGLRRGDESAESAEVDPAAPPLLGGELPQRGPCGVGRGDGHSPAVNPLLQRERLA